MIKMKCVLTTDNGEDWLIERVDYLVDPYGKEEKFLDADEYQGLKLKMEYSKEVK